MKRKHLFYIGLLAVLIFAGCGGGGNGDIEMGQITIHNLPYGYTINFCKISVNPNPQWTWTTSPSGIFVTPSNNDDWHISGIGLGFMSDSAFNTANISAGSFNKQDENWHFSDDSNTSFNYSGQASVFMYFSTRPDIQNRFFTAGFNNVQFINGRATLDFGAIRLFPDLPPTRGKFTLTGIPEEFNGKYIFLVGSHGDPLNVNALTAIYGFGGYANNAVSAMVWKGVQISSGKAEIPLYFIRLNSSPYFQAFELSLTPFTLALYIMDSQEIDFTNAATAIAGLTAITFMNMENISNINSGIPFTDGVGEADYKDRFALLP
jgi:hypothetical protein